MAYLLVLCFKNQKTVIMLKRIVLFSALVALLNACVGPSPITRLNPENEKFVWNYGQQYIEKTFDGVRVSMAFNRNEGEDLIFDVEITNNRNDSILVDPRSFYYRAENQYGTMLQTYTKAVNPEDVLLEIDKNLARQDAQRSNQAIANLVSTTAETVAVVSSLDEDPEERHELYRSIDYNRNHRRAEAFETEQQVRSLQEERAFWENNVLRTTELAPGYYIKGKVFFKRNVNAYSYDFTVPAGGHDFVFHYKQILHKP